MKMFAIFLLQQLIVSCSSLMYDVISPTLIPPAKCANGCAFWSKTNISSSWWSNNAVPANAGANCAQLANATGLSIPSPLLDPIGVGGVGAWCVCKGSTDTSAPANWGYCTSPHYVPEQVNLQLASPTTVVVSFVTFEPSVPTGLPVAELTSTTSALSIKGVTHTYVTASGNRTYFMHFVKFDNLAPRAKYTYRVKSGAAAVAGVNGGKSTSIWSNKFTFRSPYSSFDGGETSVAIFGDMGIYSWNNMINMKKDAENGDIDAVVHMGDHCYNMGGNDERRGDGYMQAYEPILTQVPWIPIVGNHEFYDGDELRRYLNQTEGSVVANNPSQSHPNIQGAGTTADTALGSMLSAGNHHGAGVHGSTPSGTSRFYSVDLGLIHFIALDLNMYNGVDNCGEKCRSAQLKWLKKDLIAANKNRNEVPWIVAMSHFPLYCSNCPAPGFDPSKNMTAKEILNKRRERRYDPNFSKRIPGPWYNSEKCEFGLIGHDIHCTEEDDESMAESVRLLQNPLAAGNDDMVPDFEPLFMQYGVDIYSSGHIHDFEYIYPTYNNTAVQKNFVNPKAPMHLVTGNGGPPSPSKFGKIMDWSYVHSTTYSYTRMKAFNSTTMLLKQISNDKNSTVLEELYLHQDQHGEFPIP